MVASTRTREEAMGSDGLLVVGGGIAGLATARALRRRGIEPDVVERSASRVHRGTGVYLPANAVSALGELGLAERLAERGRPIHQQRFLDQRGRALLEIDLHDVWGAGAECLAIGHPDLHDILSDGLTVRRGTTVREVADLDRSVRTTFLDGSRAEHGVLVGADGVHSKVRSVVFGAGGPRFLRQVSWRLVAGETGGISAWTVWLGRGCTFLAVPLGQGRTYCFAGLDRPTPDDPSEGVGPAWLARRFDDFAEPVPTLLRAGLAGGSPYFSPLEEVVAGPWSKGRVVLVGDAAHAMSPNMAEGVGMAVEDAIVLADVVAAGRPLDELEARRRDRVGFVRAQTHRRDRTRHLPPFVRDVVLGRFGQAIFRSNYRSLAGGFEFV
jgi:2-polyprenyl-6-methoxyphenol hydroxylase-like FAD-dependent oxidoreductase